MIKKTLTKWVNQLNISVVSTFNYNHSKLGYNIHILASRCEHFSTFVTLKDVDTYIYGQPITSSVFYPRRYPGWRSYFVFLICSTKVL